MFKKISPQKVKHSNGFTVEVADRHSVEYSDMNYRVRIEADFGPADVGIYFGSLTVIAGNRKGVALSRAEREDLANRIILALREMGSQVELLP